MDNEEEKKQPAEMDSTKKKKTLVIETDGNQWRITDETTCNPLEIKEICREILLRLGA